VSVVKEAAPHSPASDLGITRIGAVAALLVVAFALQTTLLTRATLLGVIPQVLLVVVVALAYSDGERVGVVTGFFAGLLQDLQLPGEASIIGLYALVFTMVGFGVGTFRRYALSESVWTPVFVVAVASAVAETGYAGLSIIMGQQWVGLTYTAEVAGLVVLYNTLLTPFVFPIVRRVGDRFRPQKVYRW
jgi:rod shape-determining protein MreD